MSRQNNRNHNRYGMPAHPKTKKQVPFAVLATPPEKNQGPCSEDVIKDLAKKVYDDTIEKMSEMLWRAEDYMAMANVLMSIYAVEMAFGDLKTIKKRIGAFADSLLPALDKIDQMGIREAYEDITGRYGLELSFEDFNLDDIWNGDHLASLVARQVLSDKGGKKDGRARK